MFASIEETRQRASSWIRIENAAWFCKAVAIWHLVLFFVFSGITIGQSIGSLTIPRLKTPITASIGAWIPSTVDLTGNVASDLYVLDTMSCPLHMPHSRAGETFYVKQYALDIGEVDTRALIIMFHFLSFVFQYYSAYDTVVYDNVLKSGMVHVSHYFEYSISASIMMIAVCAQLGVTDVFLIINVVFNCFSCMILGAIAEVCFHHSDVVFFTYGTHTLGVHWLAHFSGWIVLLFGTMVGALSNVMLNYGCVASTGSKIPEWVVGLVFAEVLLFICFGFVQMVSFWQRAKHGNKGDGDAPNQKVVDSAVNTEFAYIILSALAKTILGFGIFMGNLANK